jgi:two-component system, response regulator PdtaR
MDKKKKNVLIIEHEVIIALDIKEKFLSRGHSIAGTVSSIREAVLKRKEFQNVNLILIDSNLADFKISLRFAEKMYSFIQTPLILLVSHIDESIRKKCSRYRSVRIIEKPFRNEELINAIETAPFHN